MYPIHAPDTSSSPNLPVQFISIGDPRSMERRNVAVHRIHVFSSRGEWPFVVVNVPERPLRDLKDISFLLGLQDAEYFRSILWKRLKRYKRHILQVFGSYTVARKANECEQKITEIDRSLPRLSFMAAEKCKEPNDFINVKSFDDEKHVSQSLE